MFISKVINWYVPAGGSSVPNPCLFGLSEKKEEKKPAVITIEDWSEIKRSRILYVSI